jgi:hypothetical protein
MDFNSLLNTLFVIFIGGVACGFSMGAALYYHKGWLKGFKEGGRHEK